MNLARRPSFLIYIACVAAVLAGLVWLTWQALSLEGRERMARVQSERQELVRLALWRMESALSPIIAQEAARPYFQYRSFYPADRAYTRMWDQIEPGEVLVASPLLGGPGPYILLHFEIAPDGSVTSPQVPAGEMRLRAEAGDVSPEQIGAAEGRLGELSRFLSRQREVALSDDPAKKVEAPNPAAPETSETRQALARSEKEFDYRKQSADAARNIAQQQTAAPPPGAPAEAMKSAGAAGDTPGGGFALEGKDKSFEPATGRARRDGPGEYGLGVPSTVVQGGFEPVWKTGGPGEGPRLVFIRRVSIAGDEFIQGFWIDWENLRANLLAQVRDLIPGAALTPVYTDAGPTAQRLAAIPAELTPGAPPAAGVGLLTPTRWALGLTWAAVVAALGAVGIVLRKSIDLAERRGQFVSAVTHELRTPLTTFCLYTQMLADGMVQTEAGRADYLGTLKRESRRLARIVENVLDYARLGQRSRPRPPSQPVEDLVAAVAPTLSEQASRAGMDLVIEQAAAEGASTPADTSTVERILTNLVENSAKYASGAEDRRLHLSLARSGSVIEVRYRDHGPGIPRSEESRIFQPFHRAARDADGPTPGLGLGLALSRGLAREMGGDLRLVQGPGGGAEFLLILPAA